MKLKNCIFLTTTAFFASLTSITNALAGDGLFNNAINLGDKPNTGDTNALVIYGSIALMALIALIVINVKDSKKNKNKTEDNNIEKNDITED